MATNLKLIRMLSEEVIAEVLDETPTTLTVKNAVRIVVIPDQLNPKNPQVGLAPFLQFSEQKELVLNKNLVITTATPLTDFVNQYNSLFGGIQLPTSKIIAP